MPTGVYTRLLIPVAERFWAKVRKTPTCWIWTAALDDGYGQFWYDGRMVRAHRFAYELVIVPIPDGLEPDHLCENTACVNPDHLFLGTNADNIQDMVNKGRAQRGESHTQAIFTDDDVRNIRKLHAAGVSQSELGRRYGTHAATISKITRRKTWKHVA